MINSNKNKKLSTAQNTHSLIFSADKNITQLELSPSLNHSATEPWKKIKAEIFTTFHQIMIVNHQFPPREILSAHIYKLQL